MPLGGKGRTALAPIRLLPYEARFGDPDIGCVSPSSSISPKLTVMEGAAVSDVMAITDLVHSYARMLDRGDLAGVAELFEHATWRSAANGTILQGTAEVSDVYDRVQLYDGTPRTKHLITNLSIELDPDGYSASAQCYYTVLQGIVPGEVIQVILSGQYHDRFSKVDGRWRFADRLIVVDLSGDLTAHFSSTSSNEH